MKPLKPLPHQAEAVAAVVPGLRKHSRGQVIMACGTGKTLIGPLVADRMHAKTILVQVPSLLLARQLLGVYRRQWPSASYLAVCSDIDKVATEDAPSVDDVGCEATTDGGQVKKFLRTRGRRVVIATYQSARVLEKLSFDGAVFDEAHRTAGQKGKPFAFGLHDENVRCGWRLFMTATPRHAEIVSEEGETEEVYSMSDSEVYGPELYKLSFRKAIDLGLIVDYRIVMSVFSLGKRPSVTANQIALRKAMSRYGCSKVFTFHNTIAKASDFIESASALRGVHLSHINGYQPNEERVLALREFTKSNQAIMSNVRCLSEGVDSPSADMIAFMDPKNGEVEITQAIGRGMRTSPGKKRMVIYLPIFINEKAGEKLEDALKRTGFKKLHSVLQALQENDETMAARLGESWSGKQKKLPNVDIIVEGKSFRGGTQQKVVERIRKYVTVRMLRPFHHSTKIVKAKILACRYKLTGHDSLYTSFRRYTDPSNSVYDPAFTKKLRLCSPFQFINKVEQTKKTLIDLMLKQAPRPRETSKNKKERALATAYKHYRSKNSSAYDPVFTAKTNRYRRRSPHWFSTYKTRSKDSATELFVYAKTHAAFPRPNTRMYDKMCRFARWSSQSTYKPDVRNKLLKLRPEWNVYFLNRVNVGSIIKNVIARSGITHKNLANKIGVSKSTEEKWRRTTRARVVAFMIPALSRLYKLAKHHGVQVT